MQLYVYLFKLVHSKPISIFIQLHRFCLNMVINKDLNFNLRTAMNNTIYQLASTNVSLQSYCSNECYAIQNLTNSFIQCSCNYSIAKYSCSCNCTYNLGVIYQLNPVNFNHTCSLVNTSSNQLLATGVSFCKKQCELRLNYTTLWSTLQCNCKYVNLNFSCSCNCSFNTIGKNITAYQITPFQYPFNCTGLLSKLYVFSGFYTYF